jgi:hypothetical protein
MVASRTSVSLVDVLTALLLVAGFVIVSSGLAAAIGRDELPFSRPRAEVH